MSCRLAILLGKVVEEDVSRKQVEDQRVVESVDQPRPEAASFELQPVRIRLRSVEVMVDIRKGPSALVGRVEDSGRATAH